MTGGASPETVKVTNTSSAVSTRVVDTPRLLLLLLPALVFGCWEL
jgi:hypothetical protein